MCRRLVVFGYLPSQQQDCEDEVKLKHMWPLYRTDQYADSKTDIGSKFILMLLVKKNVL